MIGQLQQKLAHLGQRKRASVVQACFTRALATTRVCIILTAAAPRQKGFLQIRGRQGDASAAPVCTTRGKPITHVCLHTMKQLLNQTVSQKLSRSVDVWSTEQILSVPLLNYTHIDLVCSRVRVK